MSSPNDTGEYVQLMFQVTNRSDPEKPAITDEFIVQRLAGVRHTQAATLSDQIGLKHTYKAAAALGVKPQFTQEGDQVVFKMAVTVKKAPASHNIEIAASAASLSAFPEGLTIWCIDDSPSARLLLSTALKNHLRPKVVHVLGEVLEDCEAFVEGAMQDGDIAVLDQNIDFRGRSCLGTDLSRRLVGLGFQGLICIRSANNSTEDAAMYRGSGAHCVLPKDMKLVDMVTMVKQAYLAHRPPLPLPAGDLASYSSGSGSESRSASGSTNVAEEVGVPSAWSESITSTTLHAPKEAIISDGVAPRSLSRSYSPDIISIGEPSSSVSLR